MEKETKQGISGGVLCLIIVLCLLLGLASGYILHDKLSNEEETKIEEIKKEETEKNDTNQKNETEKEEKKLGTAKGIDISDYCDYKNACTKDFELSNEIDTYQVHLKIEKKEYSMSTYISLDNTKLITNQINVLDKNDFGRVAKIGILDNGIIAIEYIDYTLPAGTTRSYYKDYKLLTSIYDMINGSGHFNEDITAKEITYHNEGPCYDNDTKRDQYENVFKLNDDGTFNNEIKTKTTTTGCAGQS